VGGFDWKDALWILVPPPARFCIAGRSIEQTSSLPSGALAGTVLAAPLLFVFRYHGTWRMALLLPLSNAIVLGI